MMTEDFSEDTDWNPQWNSWCIGRNTENMCEILQYSCLTLHVALCSIRIQLLQCRYHRKFIFTTWKSNHHAESESWSPNFHCSTSKAAKELIYQVEVQASACKFWLPPVSVSVRLLKEIWSCHSDISNTIGRLVDVTVRKAGTTGGKGENYPNEQGNDN